MLANAPIQPVPLHFVISTKEGYSYSSRSATCQSADRRLIRKTRADRTIPKTSGCAPHAVLP